MFHSYNTPVLNVCKVCKVCHCIIWKLASSTLKHISVTFISELNVFLPDLLRALHQISIQSAARAFVYKYPLRIS